MLTSVVENLLCNLSMSARYISTCRLPTNRLTGRPVMSPTATCRGKHHLHSCRALAWHDAGTAQRELAHNPLVGERRVFFLLFWRGLGVFLGSGHPQSSRMYNRKLANHSRHQGELACHLIMLYPLGGLRNWQAHATLKGWHSVKLCGETSLGCVL